MKKSLFFALALAGTLCSCSSEDAIEAGVAGGNDGGVNPELVPIKFGMANNAVVTRGSGTVGDIDGSEANVWNGQTIKVFMFERDKETGLSTLKSATSNIDELKAVEGVNGIYYNYALNAPVGGYEGYATDPNKDIKYYPTVGSFDFWAYHVDEEKDGVAIGEPAAAKEPYANEAGDAMLLDISIDGSQDIMVAKAAPKDDEDLNGVTEDRLYSAFSARNGIQPTLTFNHLLTRLKFKVSVTNEVAENKDIRVKDIKVWSKKTGKLVVAYTGEKPENLIEFDETLEQLTLKARTEEGGLTDLVAYEPVELTGPGVEIGEALLVAPAEEYSMQITLIQNVKLNENDEEAQVVTYNYGENFGDLKITRDGGFVAGNSYTVNVTVWGLEEIKINTVLTGWVDGTPDGDIDINPED